MLSVYSRSDNLLHVGVFYKSLTTQEFLERSKEMENPTTHSPHRLVNLAPYGVNVDNSQNRDTPAIAVHLFEPLKIRTPGWQAICKRRQCATSCHRLAINSLQQFRVRWDNILGTTLRQMLKFNSDQLRSDVPHLPHLCHVYVEVRMQSTSECLLPYQHFEILGS